MCNLQVTGIASHASEAHLVQTGKFPNVQNKVSRLVRQRLSWSVAEYLPEKYFQGVLGGGRGATDRAYGYQSMGPLLSTEDEMWDSIWPEVDLWLLNQLRISPLRVQNEEAADVVIVPAIFAINNMTVQVRSYHTAH